MLLIFKHQKKPMPNRHRKPPATSTGTRWTASCNAARRCVSCVSSGSAQWARCSRCASSKAVLAASTWDNLRFLKLPNVNLTQGGKKSGKPGFFHLAKSRPFTKHHQVSVALYTARFFRSFANRKPWLLASLSEVWVHSNRSLKKNNSSEIEQPGKPSVPFS